MKSIRVLSGLMLATAVFAADSFANGRNPGSTLVFPVVRSGAGTFTVISVTNTNLNPVDGSTNLHYEYANAIADPNDAFCPLNCVVFDRVEFLTPADTLSVVASCHNAFAGVTEGYLVVSAENPAAFDTPWSHNYLVGSELVLSGVGGFYSLNAIPFDAIAADGASTDADGDGQLDFDGVEYEEIPDVLMIDSFIALGNSSLSLINLTGGPVAKNTVLFQVWNDNEFLLSATLTFKCWFDEPLISVSPLFSNAFLSLNTPDSPFETDLDCDGTGDIETGWARIDSILVTTTGGSIIDFDGAMLGAITAGPGGPGIDGGHLLWESVDTQANGQFVDFGQ